MCLTKQTAGTTGTDDGRRGEVGAMTIQVNGNQPQNTQAQRPVQQANGTQQSQGQFKSGQIMGSDPNARAQAGQAFMNRNPAPDPKQGIVMTLSRNGQDMATLKEKTVARTDDGRVTQKAEQVNRQNSAEKQQKADAAPEPKTAEKAQKTQKAEQAAVPKTAREAVGAEEEKRTAAKEDNGKPGTAAEEAKPKTAREVIEAQKEQRTEKAREPLTEKQEQPEKPAGEAGALSKELVVEPADEKAQTGAGSNGKERAGGQNEAANALSGVGQEDLDNMFLNGEVSLKKYQDEMNARNAQTQQAAQAQQNLQATQIQSAAQFGQADVLKVA